MDVTEVSVPDEIFAGDGEYVTVRVENTSNQTFDSVYVFLDIDGNQHAAGYPAWLTGVEPGQPQSLLFLWVPSEARDFELTGRTWLDGWTLHPLTEIVTGPWPPFPTDRNSSFRLVTRR
jgi:hypothetical protein